MLFDIINIGGRPRKGRCVIMKTHYKWQRELYHAGGEDSAYELEHANTLNQLRITSTEGYGVPSDDISGTWTVSLRQMKVCELSGAVEQEYYFSLNLDEGKFSISSHLPKRFKAQVEKLNKELA